jgi:hypothetical protein
MFPKFRIIVTSNSDFVATRFDLLIVIDLRQIMAHYTSVHDTSNTRLKF